MTKKAIGSAEFKELSQEMQFDMLHTNGVYVGKRKVENQTVVLFQLSGFYVEVFYKQYRKKIDHTVISDSADILQPYMNQIQVRDINKEIEGDNETGNE